MKLLSLNITLFSFLVNPFAAIRNWCPVIFMTEHEVYLFYFCHKYKNIIYFLKKALYVKIFKDFFKSKFFVNGNLI